MISILDFVESTKCNYHRLLKKLKRNSSYVFSATNIETAAKEIESNEEDGEPVYQNQKVQFYSMEKCFI